MTQNLSGSAPAQHQTADRQHSPEAQPMNTLDMVGMAILALIALTGLWMIVAPFLTDSQARGGDWTSGTTNDVVIGIVLAVLPLIALVTMVAGTLGDVARAARRRVARA